MKILPHMIGWLIEHTEDALPNEACGLFLGTPNHVTQVQRLANVSENPTKAFKFNHEQLLAVYQEAENNGLRIVGTWHSHPTQPPIPSDRDEAGIRHPDLDFHVIVGQRFGRRDFVDIRLYDAEWEELDHIDVPAMPFLTLNG